MNSTVQDFLVGIFLVINGIPMILCFISVIWKICLNGLLMSLLCSIVRVGTRKSLSFPQFDKVDPCAVASLLVVLKGINCGCRILISFQLRMFIIFDSAPESIKKSNSRSDVCNCLSFGLSKRSGVD